MKRPTPTAIRNLTAIAVLAIGYSANTADDRINGMSGVGGREAYERQRAFHLERLRRNDHVTDRTVRDCDAAAIEAELDELGRDFPVPILGEEIRRIK